ncbi:tryptophan 7-halogenase [Alloacidobacterium dinghuense]|uniref:Tryptophan 7-halogenase n=1 Tax=Alloacidobacterium dinghuense TaxID=2763107 RepID=A0A7G8BQ63_9BACT|nr:tryptophan 7-halogenase [Alloacidobacterium dinghuense]QNI34683.1 tryptophan 7-halogenase [Alloacidobacterium dinghuense]
MKFKYDIAIVGSGFAGSLMSMIARRLGLSVILLERGKHPRFMIGESSTPLSNLLLEELADRYDLPAIKPLAKWGSWQQHYPEIGCGLKRGFTFYHHVLGQPCTPDQERTNQLLVAASPRDQIADTHWYRADFDAFLVSQAQSLGVDYFDEIELGQPTFLDDEVELEGRKDGRLISLRAEFIVDATGPRGFLHRALQLQQAKLPNYPSTQALYSHFSGVKRLDEINQFQDVPPYPVDDAAVHHVFDGGWIWVLRFNNGITSAGIAATENTAAALHFEDGALAWDRLLNFMPMLKRQFVEARALRPFTCVRQLSFLSNTVCGDRWALLPSAAGFVDPLLSTGFPLTLLGISRLADILEREWNSRHFDIGLQRYATKTLAEVHATGQLIGSLYANMNNFPVFAALSLLYFAAASFSETARRLKKPHLAPSFLLHDHLTFGPACRTLLDRALHIQSEQDAANLIAEVLRVIEPIDVAGLCRQDRHNWYPVVAEDLFRSATKVEATPDEIAQLLHTCGFYS